jgi:DNA-binding response OmpR family regulator
MMSERKRDPGGSRWDEGRKAMNDAAVIFVLENSTDYLFLLEQAFRRGSLRNPLKVARYGNEAILYLKGIGVYADREHYPVPNLMLIDMSLPDGSALSVLGWIRRQPALEKVPVIMLVHPTQQNYLQEALDLGANSYFVTRDDFDTLIRMIRELQLPSEFSRKATAGEQRPAMHALQEDG